MLPVVWRDRARRRVLEIVDYISDYNEDAALNLEAALRHSVGQLAEFPAMGRPGRIEGTREWILSPDYLVVYRVIEGTLEIVDVLHARRRYP